MSLDLTHWGEHMLLLSYNNRQYLAEPNFEEISDRLKAAPLLAWTESEMPTSYRTFKVAQEKKQTEQGFRI